MAIYEFKADKIEKIAETSFQNVGLRERPDLQRLLKKQIGVIAEDTLVIAEEFADWEEGKRRIDLVGLDKDANLIVIELKRDIDDGRMELQAIRYAAMISTMTFEKALEVYEVYLGKNGVEIDAKESMLNFLEWEEPDEDNFAQAVRVILVSNDFSRELTTSVMWLNEQGLDIRCVRIKPYDDNGRVLVDVQQVIPLPEATDYIVGVREKTGKERIDRADRGSRLHLRYEFWAGLLERAKKVSPLYANISPSKDSWIQAGAGRAGVHYSYVTRKHDSYVELVLEGREANKAYFDQLNEHRAQIEASFGGPLQWERSDDLKKSYIRKSLSVGGYRDDKADWPEIQDAMIAAMTSLEEAFSSYIKKLR